MRWSDERLQLGPRLLVVAGLILLAESSVRGISPAGG